MNLKKVTGKLKKVRDSIKANGSVSAEDEAALKQLVDQTIQCAQTELHTMDLASMPNLPKPHNDNQALSSDQRFRLSLIEKTGTGSVTIH
ncbi:MAG: hypothetical protein AAF988_05365 [Pseudomonadota bacterium]